MLNPLVKIVFLSGVVMFSMATKAHDISLHKKENADKPNCIALEKMDQSQMDPDDPVTQAIMKQCLGHHYSDAKKAKESGQQEHHSGNKKE